MDRKAFFLIAALAAAPAAAQRTEAQLECRFTGTDFVYDCALRLERGATPIEGARVTVGADMPSMPMAHHVRPVEAKPGAAPGEYRFRLALEMPGEWAVKLRLDGPVREQLVLRYEFDDKGARPAVRRARK
ncbi:MAG: FixH family protein [Burkholderiales bacterium]|nr:FixH family protein [Burkholderiales bacterium]